MQRVLITRPRNQAGSFAQALESAGFQAIFFPVIEICPVPDMSELDQALNHLSRYDWVIFTSVNGVEVVWGRFTALGLKGVPGETRVAAIGPKTAQAIRQRGIEPAFIPEEYIAEAILPGLGELAGRWVLLPRAEIARKALPEGICREGGVAHEIAVYQTLPAQPDPIGLAALQAGVDVVTFTSPSTVHNFITLAERAGIDPLDLPGHPQVACIGPITAQASRRAGLEVSIVAESYTTEGLVAALRMWSER